MKEAATVSIAVVPAGELIPYAKNARVHSAEQIEEIKASIREFGFTNPILHDRFEIVAGHGRQRAVLEMWAAGEAVRLPGGRELPAGTIPAIDCGGWTEAQRRAYIIADNKIAENATWDDDLLKLEIAFLDGAGFELGLTGFDAAAIDTMLGRSADEDGDGGEALKVSLADRFGIAPFSVLNAREGWWQDRKRAWLDLGIMSEVGRGENLLKFSDTLNEPDPAKRAARKAAAHTEDLRGGLTHRTTTDPYRGRADG